MAMRCGDCTRLPSSCRAALLVVLIVGARADVDNSDAMQFLTAMGLPSFLPNLDVKYDIGSWGKKLRVEGAATHVKAPDDVRKAPTVEWPESSESSETVNSKFVMLMVAPDETMREHVDAWRDGADRWCGQEQYKSSVRPSSTLGKTVSYLMLNLFVASSSSSTSASGQSTLSERPPLFDAQKHCAAHLGLPYRFLVKFDSISDG